MPRISSMVRYIPGPAGQAHSSDVENECLDLVGNENLKISNPFEQRSWLAMMKSYTADSTGLLNERGFRDQFPVTVADVVDGTYDLRVPRIMVLVTSVTPSPSGDWVLETQDPTGSMGGFISTKHMVQLQDKKLNFGIGNTVLLEQVSIFVSAAPVISRHLCIHSKCVTAVWR